MLTSDWITENTQPVSGIHFNSIMLPILKTVVAFQRYKSSLIINTNPDFVTRIKIILVQNVHIKN